MRRNIVLGMCNASHGRFLLLCPVLVNIKGGSVLVESVLEVSNSSQDEPNHPCCCFPWQRCVSFIVCSFLKLLAKSRGWQRNFRLSESLVRKPKFFFVTTSSITTTVNMATVCYISDKAGLSGQCTGRKRRSMTLDGLDAEGAVQPSRLQTPDSRFKREDDGESEVIEKRGREGRFLLYWITTTSRSTSTSFTTTFTVMSVLCTTPGASIC